MEITITADEAADLVLALEEIQTQFPGNLSSVIRQAQDIATDGEGRNYLEADEGQDAHERDVADRGRG